MKDKFKAAKEIGDLVSQLVKGINAESGVFICSHSGAFGMFYAGEKRKFNEEYLPFLREAKKRIESVIEHAESGGLDISDPDCNGFVFKNDQQKFISFDEDEDENTGWGMSA